MLSRYRREIPLEAFSTGPWGKPQARNTGNLSFNITHDGTMLLAGVTNGGEVGIDLQSPIDPDKNPLALKEVFSPKEIQAQSRLPDRLSWAGYWSIKEALIKQRGSSLWFARQLEVINAIGKKEENHWTRVEGRFVYTAKARGRALALALPGEKKPPPPHFIQPSSALLYPGK